MPTIHRINYFGYGADRFVVPSIHVASRVSLEPGMINTLYLPELREMNPERLTLPGSDDVKAFMDAITEPESPELTLEKLVGVYRVLIPRKIAAYTFHMNNTSTITDAPTIRFLKQTLVDEFDDWRDGEMLIQSLMLEPADAERAATHQAKLEALIVKAGGICGPGTIGDAYALTPNN